jgi:hypothetical protein
MSTPFPSLLPTPLDGCDIRVVGWPHLAWRSLHSTCPPAIQRDRTLSQIADGGIWDDMNEGRSNPSIAVTPEPLRIAGRFTDRFSAALSSSPVMILAGALVVALILSTQLMAQPFVWENFPLDAIAQAWGRLFRNRLVVTTSIAIAIVVVSRFTTGSTVSTALASAAAIAIGAIAGELVLLTLGYENSIGGMGVFLPRVVRWCVIGLIVSAMFLLYERAGQARTSAHDATLKAAQIERQAVESRLQLLRAQIEPHFLFNTLATIRQLHRFEPGNGALMLGNFIDYLQAAIPKSRAGVPTLRDELELVRAYLGLIEVRMSGLLTSSIESDPEVVDHPFPPLSLATLVENAVKHGIVPSEHGGHIAVIARRVGDMIEASVIDSGVGLSAKSSGSGIGLANTRSRLVSLHGSAASLSLMHHMPSGVRATIRIPL